MMQKRTLIQSQTLAVTVNGQDAIITASTGSGKTLAYVWPLVMHLVENNQERRALVLVPTHELAMQVEKVAKSLLSKLPYSALVLS
jgi:superfamily II DNA/RNA helicase